MLYRKYYEILKNEYKMTSFQEEDYVFFEKHNLYLYLLGKDNFDKQVDIIKKKKIILFHKLGYKKTVSELCAVGKAFDENFIRYLSLKGISISETYPEPYTRKMGDHDILVMPKDFKRAKEVLSKLGYTDKMNISTFKDESLFKEGSKTIELHHALFDPELEPYSECFTKELWENPLKLNLNSGSVSVPKPEIHFRYITLHMMKHLKKTGFGLKFLLDFKYFSMFHNIDIEKQLGYFEKIGYGAFYRAIVTLCYYEIGLPVKSVSWLFEREAKVIQLLADFIAEGGVYGKSSEKLLITERFEKYNSLTEGNRKTKKLLIAIFPPVKIISDSYGYVVNRKWLLPVAWVHRLLRISFNRKTGIKEKLFLFTRDDMFVSEKDYMMKTLGLRETE